MTLRSSDIALGSGEIGALHLADAVLDGDGAARSASAAGSTSNLNVTACAHNALASLIPGRARRIAGIQSVQAAVDLVAMPLRQRQRCRFSINRVPQGLDQVQALGNRKRAQIVRIEAAVHKASIP